MNIKKERLIIPVIFLFLVLTISANAQSNPLSQCNNLFCQLFQNQSSGASYIATDVIGILESVGGFLIVIAGILAGVIIVWAGIMWMTAGSNQTRVASAKQIFKNGVIGAIILFAIGTIMNTIANLATNPTFFFT